MGRISVPEKPAVFENRDDFLPKIEYQTDI